VVIASVVLAGMAPKSKAFKHILFIVMALFWSFLSAWQKYRMKMATKQMPRTTQTARTSLPQGFKSIFFGGGTVMGLGVAGLSCAWIDWIFISFSLFHEWDLD
jgi:K(+)-stimulated pyrophosphate-energized sodium pump